MGPTPPLHPGADFSPFQNVGNKKSPTLPLHPDAGSLPFQPAATAAGVSAGFGSISAGSEDLSSARRRGNKMSPKGLKISIAVESMAHERLEAQSRVGPALTLAPAPSRCAASAAAADIDNGLGKTRQDELKFLLEEMMNRQTATLLDAIRISKRSPSPRRLSTCKGASPRNEHFQATAHNEQRPPPHLTGVDIPSHDHLQATAHIEQRLSDISSHDPVLGRTSLDDRLESREIGRIKRGLSEILQMASARNFNWLPRAIRASKHCLQWWEQARSGVQLKVGTRWIDKLVHSYYFSLFCGLLIMLHACASTFEANYFIENYSASLPKEFLYVELGFMSWYAAEICLRLISGGLAWLVGPNMAWNLFDVALILVTTLIVFGAEISDKRFGFLRTLRVIRVVKIVRFFRMVDMLGLQRLRLMVNCIVGSATTLLWCVVLLRSTAFIFSLYFVHALATSLNDMENSGDPATDGQLDGVYEFFGSVQGAMLSLFMAISGGLDWYEFWMIVGLAGFVAQALFVFYVLFCMIAVLNVITSIFIEKVLSLAQPDAHQQMLEARRQQLRRAQQLWDVFEQMDVDSSGTLSLGEFTECLQTRADIRHLLIESGVNIRDAQTFFNMVLKDRASDEDELDIKALISTCLHIQGVANNLDVQVIRYEMKELMRGQKKLMSAMAGGSRGALGFAERSKACLASPVVPVVSSEAL